jgi:AAA ATPase-like protein
VTVGVLSPHLLEREPELEALAEAVARTGEGAGRALLMEAPAGLGKSRLLASTAALAEEAGLRVCTARGALREREFAFGVARQLYERPVSTATESESDALFAGAAELSRRLFGHDGPGTVAQDADAVFGALHGLYWLTVNLTDSGPLLLAVDDAHWSDASSLQFLGYLLRRLAGLPVLLVVAGRTADPDAEPLWRELADDPAAEVMRLRALTEGAVRDVLTRELRAEPDEGFVAACHRATGGNPLFLRELVGAVKDAGLAPTADAAARVTEVGPPAVSRFVIRRLERLGPASVELARAAAVLGDAGDLGLAARVAGLEPDAARRAADLLVEADVFAPSRHLRFVHPIVEAAIYEDLLPGDRDARHLAAARLLDEAAAPAERVATHVLLSRPAGDPRWVAVLRSAAASAAERGAPQHRSYMCAGPWRSRPPSPSADPCSASSGGWRSRRTARSDTRICSRLSTRLVTRRSRRSPRSGWGAPPSP